MTNSRLEWAVSRPRFVLAACVVVGALAWLGASRLGFEAGYAALLPADSPVVSELEAVKRDLGGGTSDLVIILSGPEQARDALAHELARALAENPRIARADAEIPRAFFEDRALYLVERRDLDELARRVAAAYRASIARAMAVVDLDDPDDPDSADPWRSVLEMRDELIARYSWQRRQVSADGSQRYLFVRPRVASVQLAEARSIVTEIQTLIQTRSDQLDSARAGVDVALAGWLMIHLAEQQSSAEDLRRATLIALVLVVIMLTVVLRRLAAPIVVAVPLVLSLVITLAVATVLVGNLNLISAFTLPALVGLGIDFGIHLYTRFVFESTAGASPSPGEPDEGSPGQLRERAMRRAIRATIGASATSAITTAAAFLSLALVEFRGFREFGILGGAGVLVTLVTTYAVLPPLAIVLTRAKVSSRAGSHPRPARSAPRRWSRILAGVVVMLGAIGAIVAGLHLSELAFENDFRRLRGTSEVITLTESLEDELGVLLNPTVFVVPDLDAARAVEEQARQLHAARASDGEEHRIGIAEVASAARLIPADMEERSEVLAGMRSVLERALAFGEDVSPALRDPERLRALERLIELTSVEPHGLDDLPVALRRRLVAADGDALIAFVWPDDRLYRDTVMLRWLDLIDTLRARVEAAIGPERAAGVRVLDERRIPLDVVALIRRDLPRALTLACALVLLALFVHFRRVTIVLAVAGSMALAMLLLLGALAVTGVQLNVYNAVVLPCIVGVGIDNAVHIRHAYQRMRGARGAIGRVLATTGVAALLSSITTGIGFGAAMIARQGGLQSMGLTAMIGVACALFATTAVLPAAIHLIEGRRRST